jgi:hypothetical protein
VSPNTLGKGILFAECHPIKVLGKEAVADVQFTELSLPSVTLGKAFAECFPGFAECFRHLAKRLFPIVVATHAAATPTLSCCQLHPDIFQIGLLSLVLNTFNFYETYARLKLYSQNVCYEIVVM